MQEEKILLTTPGKKRLAGELENLKNVERPAIVRAIADARAHGDLSENAEYHSAKERQGFIERRLRELEWVLAQAEVFDPADAANDGRALFGSTVEVRDPEGGTVSYQIVSVYEADTVAGKISVKSPLGKALIGKRAGEKAEVEAPSGPEDYDIISVSRSA